MIARLTDSGLPCDSCHRYAAEKVQVLVGNQADTIVCLSCALKLVDAIALLRGGKVREVSA